MSSPIPTSTSPLRDLAQERGFEIGAAVAIDPLRSDPKYAEVLGEEFNLVVPENAMKWAAVEPVQGQFDFRQADLLVDFAQKNAMRVRGHCLVWHQALPDWVQNGQWTKETLSAALQSHITGEVKHFRGNAFAWDVVNEAIDEDGSLRQTLFYNTIGPEYLDLIFKWAHEADPDALLFYNDSNGEGLGRKSDAIYALVKGMKERGVPIHGVGLQMHISQYSYPADADLRANIQRLGELGLVVHITELDVRLDEPFTAQKLEQQARIYRSIAQNCLAEKACRALLMWGFTDKYSWIPGFFQGYGSGLIFDEAYRPKLAYGALAEALAGK